MYDKVQNPDVLDKELIDLVGGYRLIVPAKASPFYKGGEPINMGHVRNPGETYTATTKKVDTSVYGLQQTVIEIPTKTEETGTFETVSVKDIAIRGLWAGSAAYQSASAGAASAEVWAANKPYAVGDFVVPTSANGRYYEVTAGGTSDASEPVWPTNNTSVTDSGVTYADKGVIPADNGLIVIPRNHTSYDGMLIDVVQSAIEGRTPEIYVAPNITIRGDGYAGGRNSTDETSLKFAYTILSAGTYQLPSTLGVTVEKILGGFDILNVPVGGENAVIDKIIAGYYA